MTNKEMIAAFYRELYDGKKGMKEYKDQAKVRLGIILRQFQLANKYFPTSVQDPEEFFSYYESLNYFPKRKKKFEKLSDGMLIGKIDMEFRAYLKAEQKKLRPVLDPKRMPEPEPKPRRQTELEPFGVDIPPKHEERYRKDASGHWLVDGERADYQLDKIILGFRTLTDEEKANDNRATKHSLRFIRWLKKKKKLAVLDYIIEHLMQDDPWNMEDAIDKIIEEKPNSKK